MILYAEKYGNCMTESVGRIILSYNNDNNSYKNNTSNQTDPCHAGKMELICLIFQF